MISSVPNLLAVILTTMCFLCLFTHCTNSTASPIFSLSHTHTPLPPSTPLLLHSGESRQTSPTPPYFHLTTSPPCSYSHKPQSCLQTLNQPVFKTLISLVAHVTVSFLPDRARFEQSRGRRKRSSGENAQCVSLRWSFQFRHQVLH